VACSFIALAAWVRQFPFWLLNSRVVTECLQTGHLNVEKPFIILTPNQSYPHHPSRVKWGYYVNHPFLNISWLCGTVLRSAFAPDEPYDRTKFSRSQSITITRAHHSTRERTARRSTVASITRNSA
jgi:hypothetical protein